MRLDWKGSLIFEATSRTGETFVLNGDPSDDPATAGPSPMQALLAAVGACAAMDVISILEKKRQPVESYSVEVSGERPPEGTYPRPWQAMRVVHRLKGKGIDPSAVERALQLSDEKYCSVMETLRINPSVTSEFVIEE